VRNRACQAAKQTKKQKRAQLRGVNAGQKRPNVIRDSTKDDMNSDRYVGDAKHAPRCSAPAAPTFQNSYVSTTLLPLRATRPDRSVRAQPPRASDQRYGDLDNTKHARGSGSGRATSRTRW